MTLPEAGWDDMARVMQIMLDAGLLSLQCMWSLVGILPKTARGVRPITLLCMVYRWLTKCFRTLVSQWDTDNAPEWDYDVPGKGAYQAAFEEELLAEAEVLDGQHLADGLM